MNRGCWAMNCLPLMDGEVIKMAYREPVVELAETMNSQPIGHSGESLESHSEFCGRGGILQENRAISSV